MLHVLHHRWDGGAQARKTLHQSMFPARVLMALSSHQAQHMLDCRSQVCATLGRVRLNGCWVADGPAPQFTDDDSLGKEA